MTRYRAAWVVPVAAPPIRNGWIDVEGGRIIGTGVDDGRPSSAISTSDLGDVALVPGFVNAHTHLELSALRGRLPRARGLPDWVRRLMTERPALDEGAVERAMADAIRELDVWGTSAVGDVSNTLASVAMLASRALDAVVFHELIGFAERNGQAAVDAALATWTALAPFRTLPPAPGVRLALAAHAPYSVSPEVLRAVGAWLAGSPDRRTTLHLAESRDELALLEDGTGEWRQLLDDLGVWRSDWTPPATDPVAYADRFGLLGPRSLVVHGVQLDEAGARALAARRATLVLCPRSNRFVGEGDAPVSLAYRAGVRAALGTDSLASAPDLGVPGELAAARRLAPEVPARWLLRAATLGGARALGFEDLGALAPGFRARVLAVAVPPGCADVEEYVVSGLDPASLTWVEPAPDP
jgi:cytosine/adenosine deaminase-related metal-dependent hydrolase